MRNLHKSWKDKPYNFTRRMRWYVGPVDIRIAFEDQDGGQNKFYDNQEAAQKDWDAFKKNELTVTMLRRSR